MREHRITTSVRFFSFRMGEGRLLHTAKPSPEQPEPAAEQVARLTERVNQLEGLLQQQRDSQSAVSRDMSSVSRVAGGMQNDARVAELWARIGGRPDLSRYSPPVSQGSGGGYENRSKLGRGSWEDALNRPRTVEDSSVGRRPYAMLAASRLREANAREGIYRGAPTAQDYAAARHVDGLIQAGGRWVSTPTGGYLDSTLVSRPGAMNNPDLMEEELRDLRNPEKEARVRHLIDTLRHADTSGLLGTALSNAYHEQVEDYYARMRLVQRYPKELRFAVLQNFIDKFETLRQLWLQRQDMKKAAAELKSQAKGTLVLEERDLVNERTFRIQPPSGPEVHLNIKGLQWSLDNIERAQELAGIAVDVEEYERSGKLKRAHIYFTKPGLYLIDGKPFPVGKAGKEAMKQTQQAVNIDTVKKVLAYDFTNSTARPQSLIIILDGRENTIPLSNISDGQSFRTADGLIEVSKKPNNRVEVAILRDVSDVSIKGRYTHGDRQIVLPLTQEIPIAAIRDAARSSAPDYVSEIDKLIALQRATNAAQQSLTALNKSYNVMVKNKTEAKKISSKLQDIFTASEQYNQALNAEIEAVFTAIGSKTTLELIIRKETLLEYRRIQNANHQMIKQLLRQSNGTSDRTA